MILNINNAFKDVQIRQITKNLKIGRTKENEIQNTKG